ncbi:pyridoxamine 5'-phosphate oxidase family protein [Desertibaculum subflavum]|uniref:pyridoxamine 5'-phosphate oxidase family protein n=1 Tax=Desertibaculum subflavum TaxID=2268458 RepID=UPI000E66B2E9
MNAMSHAEQAKLWEIVRDIPVALLTTDDRGTLRSRPMVAQQPTFDGTLWFFTRRSSHKSIELGDNYHVNLSYASPEQNAYVSVSGLAQVVQDPAKQRELWNDEVARWIPSDPADDDLALLKVEVQQAEYWSGPATGGAQKRPARRASQQGKVSFD